MSTNIDELRAYLLGALADDEASEIELRILSDDDFAIELDLAEHDLIESFLTGGLSKAEMELFEDRFMSVESRRADVEVTRALRAMAARQPVVAPRETEPKGWFRIWRIPIAVAAILLIVVGTAIVLVRSGGGPNAELAELNRTDLHDLSSLKGNTLVPLLPLRSRASTGPTVVHLREASPIIILRLAVLQPTTAGMDVTISREGGDKTLYLSNAAVYPIDGSGEIRMLLKADWLSVGRYQIKIRSGDATADLYELTVAD
jgi:hypothetical protein